MQFKIKRIINYLKLIENIEISYYNGDDKVEDSNQELLKIRVKTNDSKIANDIENEINTLFKNEVIAHATFPTMYYDDINFSLVDIVSIKAGKEKSIKQLLDILDIFKGKKVKVIIGSFILDFTKGESDPMVMAMVQMLGVFSQMERDIIFKS